MALSRSFDCQNPFGSSCERSACHWSRSQQHPAAFHSRIFTSAAGSLGSTASPFHDVFFLLEKNFRFP